jgi:putative transcriptional regulator
MHHGGVESLRGHLLISGASLWDPNFRRTVVLIGHHDEGGAVGVVLNQPSPITVEEAVPVLAGLVEPGALLSVGGPVQPEAAVVLADFAEPEHAEIIAVGSVGFLPEEVDPADMGPILRARIFAGYSGWAPGQLEMELEQDSWIVVPALPDDVFEEDPDKLWSDVLRRKGPGFELMRVMPVDPSQN